MFPKPFVPDRRIKLLSSQSAINYPGAIRSQRPLTMDRDPDLPAFKRAGEDEDRLDDRKRLKLDSVDESPAEDSSIKDAKHDKKNTRKGKEKKEKNKGRRRGSRTDERLQDDDRPKTPRLPKKQSALLIGFCGTGCAGMQM
jgi:tRNA pseudouridine38-40 synthase